MFDTKIVFRDGSTMTIPDCDNYKLDKGCKILSIQKNGSNILLNFEDIRYIGVSDDLEPLPSSPESTV
ncbi:MAG: hypothetical protein E7511_05770 [Ruminococcus sp.]|nr:hypothetical protein [Ruminococcus sp.]